MLNTAAAYPFYSCCISALKLLLGSLIADEKLTQKSCRAAEYTAAVLLLQRCCIEAMQLLYRCFTAAVYTAATHQSLLLDV
jgi:hypothetical protein